MILVFVLILYSLISFIYIDSEDICYKESNQDKNFYANFTLRKI